MSNRLLPLPVVIPLQVISELYGLLSLQIVFHMETIKIMTTINMCDA